MKKLLAIVLVLVVASAAQATLSWTASEVGPAGGAVSVALKSSTTVDGFSIGALKSDTPGVTVANVAGGGGLGYTNVEGPYLDNTSAGILFDTFIAYWSPTALAAGGNIMTFQLNIPQLPASTIIRIHAITGEYQAGDGGIYTAGPSTVTEAGAIHNIPELLIHITPEPMTLTLLALGGLAVLRRRH